MAMTLKSDRILIVRGRRINLSKVWWTGDYRAVADAYERLYWRKVRQTRKQIKEGGQSWQT